MIEKTVLDYLGGVFESIPVLMEVPEVPSETYSTFPEKLIVIELVGKRKSNHVYAASIAFQSYAMSLYEAAALDESVRAAVEGMPALANVGGVTLSSNYNFTDTRTKRYRYQCVYDIYYVE